MGNLWKLWAARVGQCCLAARCRCNESWGNEGLFIGIHSGEPFQMSFKKSIYLNTYILYLSYFISPRYLAVHENVILLKYWKGTNIEKYWPSKWDLTSRNVCCVMVTWHSIRSPYWFSRIFNLLILFFPPSNAVLRWSSRTGETSGSRREDESRREPERETERDT